RFPYTTLFRSRPCCLDTVRKVIYTADDQTTRSCTGEGLKLSLEPVVTGRHIQREELVQLLRVVRHEAQVEVGVLLKVAFILTHRAVLCITRSLAQVVTPDDLLLWCKPGCPGIDMRVNHVCAETTNEVECVDYGIGN